MQLFSLGLLPSSHVALVNTSMSVSDDSFQAPPAAPANRSSIASSQAMNRAPQIPSKISLSRGSSSKLSRKDADKVGRWSDEEHQVFLVGLEKHGKQWKTIATMIGTRTVVQVSMMIYCRSRMTLVREQHIGFCHSVLHSPEISRFMPCIASKSRH